MISRNQCLSIICSTALVISMVCCYGSVTSDISQQEADAIIEPHECYLIPKGTVCYLSLFPNCDCTPNKSVISCNHQYNGTIPCYTKQGENVPYLTPDEARLVYKTPMGRRVTIACQVIGHHIIFLFVLYSVCTAIYSNDAKLAQQNKKKRTPKVE